MRIFPWIAGAVALSLFDAPALAWGPEGHAIVADIATARLTPQAKAEVQRLLALEGHSQLDEVSSWPDAIRAEQPDTGPWHFVDIPLSAVAYDAQRDCHYDRSNNRVAEETCIVAKLPQFVALLSDKSKPDADRLRALKFVVHLVGDIHQPLHAEDNADRGGNEVHLTYFGKNTKLHAMWDSDILEQHYSWTLGPNYSFDHRIVGMVAAAIDNEIAPSATVQWAPSGLLSGFDNQVVSWANETHGLAPAAYAHLPHKNDDQSEVNYQDYAWPVVETQLQRAGVRLAEVLNESL